MRPTGSVFIATSLDGFIARPDGRIDWLSSVEQPGEDYGYQRFFDSVDVLVTGRNTYDTVLGFNEWPYKGKRCVVLTHRPPEARHGETFYAGDPVMLMEDLAREGVRRVYVDGGQVVSAFLEHELVDEITISILPVLLGEGIPLFKGDARERRLVLEESRAFPKGLVQVRYRVSFS